MQSPCTTGIRLRPAEDLLALFLNHFEFSFVSEFGSFTRSRGTNPTRRELAAEALLVRDGAGGNASDKSDVCDWRERLLAEAQRKAKVAARETSNTERQMKRANKFNRMANREHQSEASSRSWR